jgi:hypothetical protein
MKKSLRNLLKTLQKRRAEQKTHFWLSNEGNVDTLAIALAYQFDGSKPNRPERSVRRMLIRANRRYRSARIKQLMDMSQFFINLDCSPDSWIHSK